MRQTAVLSDLALESTWENSGGAIVSGPTTAQQTLSFSISGIPAGSAIQSAAFSASFGSPYSGTDTLSANNIPVGYGLQTIPLTPTADGNGNYTVILRFRAFGLADLPDGEHSGAVLVSAPTVAVEYEPDEEEEEEEEAREELDRDTAEQTVVFFKRATQYADNGVCVLTPFSSLVHEVAGGEYSLSMEHPMDAAGKWALLTEEALIRSPVPEKWTPRIVMPPTQLWKVTASTTPLYSVLPTWTKAETPVDQIIQNPAGWEWQTGTNYAAGDYVTFQGKIWSSKRDDNAGHYPGYNDYWNFVLDYSGGGGTPEPEYIYDPGVIAETLAQDETISFVADYNGSYIRARSLRGTVGYVRRADCAETGSAGGETVIAPRHITTQVFRVKSVTVNDDTRTVSVYAEQISYDLSANCLYDCQLQDAAPATAIGILQGALVNPDARLIATPMVSPAITADWSWQSPLAALLDPDTGLVPQLRAQLVRDNGDLFILPNDAPAAGTPLVYGVNLQGVSWDRDREGLVTRVIPRGEKEDGSVLLLPEVFVDSPLIEDYALIYTEPMDCQCRVGETIKNADGTEKTLTQADCYQIMREKAQARFTKDEADAISVRVRVNPLLLGDTEEYKQYKGLSSLHLYDAVPISVPHAFMDTTAQISEYTWDAAPGRRRYTSIILGKVFSFGGRTVAGYNVSAGAITYDKLAPGAIKRIRSL